jgi:hypothetical protein
MNNISDAHVYWNADQTVLSAFGFDISRQNFSRAFQDIIDEAEEVFSGLVYSLATDITWEGLREEVGNADVDFGFFGNNNPVMQTMQRQLIQILVGQPGALIPGTAKWNPTFLLNWMKRAQKLNCLLMVLL